MVPLSTVVEGCPSTSGGIASPRYRALHRLHHSSSLLLTFSLLLLAVTFSSALPMTNLPASARMFIQDRAIYDSPQHHHHSRYVIQQRLLKKSQAPKWEDLGWAWGKKRADPAMAAPTTTQWDDLGWAWGKKKRGDPAMADPTTQWDDLGWAWGRKKRAVPAATQWDDLGWAWGKRSKQATRDGKGTEWDDLGWAWGKRSSPGDQPLSIKSVVDDLANEAAGLPMNTEHLSPKQQRAVQSLVKKNPDWHDLGWAWGRRR